MGIESRDWYRDGERRRRRKAPGLALATVVVLVGTAVVVALGVLPRSGRSNVTFTPLAGLSPGGAHAPLYANGDPWLPYLADERTCPGGEDETRPMLAQANTMVCLINYARSHLGLSSLTVSTTLSGSARLKGDDILRCNVFAHAPCGGDAAAGVRGLGYGGSFGENLYIADGRFGAPRVALDQWLNSPGHRENLFRPQWRVQSLYVVKIDRFREYRGATLWVSQFGDQ